MKEPDIANGSIYSTSKIFSYQRVKELMCEGCNTRIPEVFSDGMWLHCVMGQRIVCQANGWRRSDEVHKIVEAEAK